MLLFQDWSPWLVSFWFCQSFRLPRICDWGVLDSAVSGDDLNHSVVWVESGAFAVCSITGRVAIAVVKDDSFGNGGGVVGSVDEHGAFVDVGVAGEDDVDAAAFENGHDVLTHFDELTFFV